MKENKLLYEVTKELEKVGYDCYYDSSTEVRLYQKEYHLLNIRGFLEVTEVSLSLTIVIKYNIDEIYTKTHHNITVSDAIRILTSMLKHVEEIYTKAQKDLKLFEVTLYPVNVGLEEAIKYIEELLICCDFEPQRKGVWRIDRVGSMLKVHVDKGKRIIEIFICGDRIDWELIYRREINIKNNKEMCEEIKSIIDKFKQLYLPPEVVVETFFKEL